MTHPGRSPSSLLGTTVALLSLAAFGCKEAPKAGGPPAASAPTAASSAPPASEAPSTSAERPVASASSATGARPTAGATMKVLDAGQPPRRKLRYAWHLDQKEQLAMDLRTAASTEARGATQPEVSLPSVHVALAIDPQSVTPDGDLRYAWRVTSARSDARDDTPSEVTEGMRAEVAAIAGLSGSAVVTSRGLAKDVTVDPGSSVEALTSQMAEQVRQTLRDIAAPLPDEEVGAGARWRKLSQLDERGARVTQTETFRLVDLDGDRGTLADALAQTAPPQALRAPATSPGARARMESMLASGEAKVRFDLSRLVPQTTFDGTTTMVLSGQSPGDSARSMKMVMHVFIAIAGSRR
ncbi:MAG TPA: hypothetical protein VN894_00665 [Polyangiaceae bacterium]|nr:hypothetical protein [Polyangiaceae bacterium]